MLKAACELFLREGIRDLNLHKIADKLGVSRHDLHAAVGDKRNWRNRASNTVCNSSTRRCRPWRLRPRIPSKH